MDKVIGFLDRLDLGQYSSNFENEGWDRLKDLQDMTDEDLHQVIEKPGHVGRLQIAIKQQRLVLKEQEASIPLAALHQFQMSKVGLPSEIRDTYYSSGNMQKELVNLR